MKRHIALAATLVLLSVVSTSCLKTRAQLKGEDDNGQSQPVKTEVKDVLPQGGYVIDELKGEMTRMEGRIQDLERGQADRGKAEGSSKEELKKLETRVVELEQAQAAMLEAIKKMQESAATKPVAASEGPELLQKAKSQLDDGDTDAAIESLTAYLKIPRAKGTEEATFLRGEAYFSQKQYKKAIVDFSRFPEKYTKSKRMPAALFRIGQSFDAMGMKDDAKGFYQELVEKYPQSAEAKKARKRAK